MARLSQTLAAPVLLSGTGLLKRCADVAEGVAAGQLLAAILNTLGETKTELIGPRRHQAAAVTSAMVNDSDALFHLADLLLADTEKDIPAKDTVI